MGKGLKWTEEEQRRLLQLRAAGKSIVEIAELLKRTQASVSIRISLLRRHGLQRAAEGPFAAGLSRIAQLDQRTALPDQCLHSAEADVRPPRRKSGFDCVKKTRERHAVGEMRGGPSESPCRRRLQTAMSCFGQKPRW